MANSLTSTLLLIFLVARNVEAGVLNIAEGGDCLHTNGITGVCSKITNCRGKTEKLKIRNEPRDPVCSFLGSGRNAIPIICCTVGRPGEKSVQACESVKEQASRNFNAFDGISNGVNAREKFPHMALLGYENADTDPDFPDWRCGGSLISDRFVLTAAHCVITQSRYGNLTTVRLGENNTSIVEPAEKDFKVDWTIVHPDYKPNANWYNDIALIRLKEKVIFNNDIYPGCLYTKPDEPRSLIISGWGSTYATSDTMSGILLEGKNELETVEAKDCTARYKKRRGDEKSVPDGITPTMFCASHWSLDTSSDTCQGDSGGPIQLRNIKPGANKIITYEVVGVTSGGPSLCGGEPPGVYTRIYYYLDWIENIIEQDKNVISQIK